MYRASVYYFGALLLLAIPAFWPTYLFPPNYESDWHVHLHGLAMFAWVALMIAQASLIRGRHAALHRRLGKVSYGLVPLMVLSTVLLAGYRLRQKIDLDALYFLYVQLFLIALLATSWMLAMANRRQPQVHMRYMACVALTLVDPILARVLFFYGGMDFPATQVVTFGVVDAILIALALHDRAHHPAIRVYPRMLLVFVIAQLPTFFLYKLPAWQAFAEAYAALPLP